MLATVGIDLTSAQSMAEIRAMYGGAQVGFGGFLLLASRQPHLQRPGLLALALVMGGFALGRLCGIALDRTFDSITLVSLATEVILFALATFTLTRNRTPLAEAAA
jgi:fucose permease